MLFSNYLFVQPKFLCVLNGVPHHCHIGTYKSLRNMTNCIWCTEATEDLAEEHIIPDAIGCPYDLILRNGEVCKSCNNRLGHLDRAVADEFDMVAFNENVPRKDGKVAAIRSRGNVVATRSPTGSVVTINMEKRSVKAHDGTTVGAYGKSTRNINARFERHGQFATISGEIEFGQGPKFLRGISKIALSSFTYYMGADQALSALFDPVRLFVLEGQGDRPIIIKARSDMATRLNVPIKLSANEYVVPFSVLCIDFYVDLSPNMSGLPTIKKWMLEQHGEDGWTLLGAAC
jgi:HNH endonuclease